MQRLGKWVVAVWLLSTLAGCNDGPFSYTPVSGKITYEDGELIPAATIKLTFVSLETPKDPNIRPRPASTGVNIKTGEFGSPTSVKAHDGIVAGRHRIVIDTWNDKGESNTLLDPEYNHPDNSPLVVDTADAPFDLKVRRPTKPLEPGPRDPRMDSPGYVAPQ